MPFIASGKKAKKKVERDARRDRVLDRVMSAVLVAIQGPRLCLPICVLTERILNEKLPGHGFTLRLGALNVLPLQEAIESISFDPRGPEGIDGGFHAWLEHSNGELLDPSIQQTLAHEGYPVPADEYFTCREHTFDAWGLRMIYEELTGLELIGVEESEPHLARLMGAAMGIPVTTPGTIHLDLRWQPSR